MEKYKKICSKFIKEINSEVSLYIHNKTKAKICLISNDDNNKVFTIGFRTPPIDDSGLTHILEHSVLCGSTKYQVKDPFIELVKSSLNTFLNAITYPDKTIYPCASQNLQDFKNLTDVYLDAVFNPLIYQNKEIFYQEGWHYELNKKTDDIKYNGVVYNEMKGAFSDPEQVLLSNIMKSLYPNTAYRFESGGDPKEIVKLSYERFVDFHKKYYHPSNAYIYFYGNCDMEERLNYLDTYLTKYEYSDFNTKIAYQEPFEKPLYLAKNYSVNGIENLKDKSFLSYNVVCNNDQKAIIALGLILAVLFQTPGAPITKKIIDLKLAEDVSVSLTTELLQPLVNIVLTNSNLENEEKFINLINEELKHYIINGLPHEEIKTLMNFNEFKLREAMFGQTPRGLNVILASFSSFLYTDNDPFSGLEVLKYYKELINDINNGYFEDILAKYILNNNHKSYVSLSPILDLNKLEEEETKIKLKQFKESLSEFELDSLIKLNADLLKYQETSDSKEAINNLPKLKKEDLNYESEELNFTKHNDFITYSNYFTNGINYFMYLFDISNLNNEDMLYLSTLTKLLTNIDTTNYSYKDYNQMALNLTGGISFTITNLISRKLETKPYLIVRFSATTNNLFKANELVKEVCFNTLFTDKKRIKEKLNEAKVDAEYGVADRANILSLIRAYSHLNKAYYLNDLISGLSYNFFLKEILKDFNDDVINNLERVYKLVFNKKRFVSHFISETINNELNIKTILNYYDSLKENTYISELIFNSNNVNEAFKSNFNTNYVSLASTYKKDYNGAFYVLANILNYNYLWPEVRVKGGAYGVYVSLSYEGLIGFCSYRDPHLQETLDRYKNIVNFIANLNLTNAELLDFKIGVFSNLDLPLHNKFKGEKALFSYLKKENKADLDKIRKEIIDCDLLEIKELAGCFKEALESGVVCVIGTNADIDNKKELFNEIKDLN